MKFLRALRYRKNRFVVKADQQSFECGFTMVELAIVILVVTLVSAGLLRPVGLYIEQRKIAETRETLETAKEALINFALLNKRLPCPDTDNPGDGIGNGCAACAGGPPASCAGWIPFAELSISGQDAWGNRIGYQVSQNYANNTGITLASDSTINIDTRINDPLTITVEKVDPPPAGPHNVADRLPAILIFHGPNGLGAFKMDGNQNALPGPGSIDEVENIDMTNDHWHARTPTPDVGACDDDIPGQPYCEFDDILIWISPHVLKSRMVQAGRLP